MRRDLPAAGALLLLAFAAAEAPVYEEPPILSADLLLPERLREGPHHRVAEVVTNDGYLNTYVIESDFGLFTARGDDLLRVRLGEVAALAALGEITRSEAFARAAAAAAQAPFATAARVVTRPGGTLKRLPSGVSRYFRRTVRKVEKAVREADEYLTERREGPDAGEGPPEGEGSAAGAGDAEPAAGEGTGEEESDLEQAREVATDVTRRYLGVGRSMREWAGRLGVDPYTTNETLRRELERVAAAAAVGRFGVRLATPGLGVVGDLREVDALVWTTSGADLEVLNIERLKTMGLRKGEIEALLRRPAWSPSRLTGLVTALHRMPGVRDRGDWVRLAAAAGSEEEAFFFQRSVEMLRRYHREVARLRRIVAGEVWGGGVTAAGAFVVPLAVDYLAWTEEAAVAFSDAGGELRARGDVERLELWLAGGASPRARAELEALGWAVEERARERWLER